MSVCDLNGIMWDECWSMNSISDEILKYVYNIY